MVLGSDGAIVVDDPGNCRRFDPKEHWGPDRLFDEVASVDLHGAGGGALPFASRGSTQPPSCWHAQPRTSSGSWREGETASAVTHRAGFAVLWHKIHRHEERPARKVGRNTRRARQQAEMCITFSNGAQQLLTQCLHGARLHDAGGGSEGAATANEGASLTGSGGEPGRHLRSRVGALPDAPPVLLGGAPRNL